MNTIFVTKDRCSYAARNHDRYLNYYLIFIQSFVICSESKSKVLHFERSL